MRKFILVEKTGDAFSLIATFNETAVFLKSLLYGIRYSSKDYD